MRRLFFLVILLLSAQMCINTFAQTLPLVYSVENTGSDCPVPYMPALSRLPVNQALPDPFEWADGRGRINYFSDWECRRAEIGAQIQHYEIGEKPPRPDSITASFAGDSLTVIVTVNGRTLTLVSRVILPAGAGPFPAVIGVMTPTGSIPDSIFKSRNIAEIAYNINQVTAYGNPQTSDPYYRLYPNLNPSNTGQYSAWAWGVSRIIDGLELVQNVLSVDLKHVAVTGCSYAGKLALFAGAFDERIALTIAQESGGGGATSWRYSHFSAGSNVEEIDNTDYNWFKDDMHQFAGDNVYRMPEDHHELMAMVAPRALYVTANPSYTWLSNPSCYVASEGAKQVYKALGISGRFGFSIVGNHLHCQVPDVQIPEIEAFVDKFLLGKDSVNTDTISDSPYNFDLSSWINWTNPVLSNGTSYFGKTTLLYPADMAAALDTNITFKWNSVKDADKYYIELTTDPTFRNIDVTDSTADTVKSVGGLTQGGNYYWRVEVNSAAGPGPWSDVRSFSTFIPAPASSPQPAKAQQYQGRQGFYTFSWTKIKNASQYLIQTSLSPAFTNIFNSASTSDSSKTLSGFEDVQRYYWRVRASNITGPGPWSDTSSFSTLPAPTNLVLQNSGADEITLTWTINSANEDGSVIERKLSTQKSFSVLDTLTGTANSYTDKNLEAGQTYTYRVCVYKDSVESDFSNEAALLITGVVKENGLPAEFSLSQNYPNPFNPTTIIKFALPKSVLTKLAVYDLLGRKVKTLIDGVLQAGYHEVSFNAIDLSNGVYFYRIQAGNFTETKKLIVLK